MLKRSITGAVILMLTLLFVVLKQFSPIFFDVYVLIFMYGSLYEMYKAHQISGKDADFVSLFFVPIFSCIAFNLEQNYTKALLYVGLMAIAVLIISLSGEIITFSKDRRYGTTEKNISVLNQSLFNKTKQTMMVFAYPVLPLLFLMALNHIVYDLSYIGLILTFAISMLTDTCAYLVGKFFGKRKFIPEVSPNKTIAGVAGGFAGGIIGSLVCYLIFYNTSLFKLASFGSQGLLISVFLIIGVVGSFITQLGDLIASAYKRKHSIKDFSNVFPGHGGFMDRADGLMFNAVLIYIVFIIFLV